MTSRVRFSEQTPESVYRLELARGWLGAQPGFDQRNAPDPEDVNPECRPAETAKLMHELALLSMDPDSTLDRDSDVDIWGFDREEEAKR